MGRVISIGVIGSFGLDESRLELMIVLLAFAVVVLNIIVRLEERLILDARTERRVTIVTAVAATGSGSRVGRNLFGTHFIIILLPLIVKMAVINILAGLIIVRIR